MLFMAMASNFQTTYISLFTKNTVTKVLKHEKHTGGVHFALRGYLGVVGAPECLIRPSEDANIRHLSALGRPQGQDDYEILNHCFDDGP